MRNMSFALTTEQIRARTKTVTRRLGWEFLKPGDLIRAVEKCQGLKKGEKVKPLAVLRVERVTYEPLKRLTDDLDYGFAEVAREGFGDHPTLRWPTEFVSFFAATHRPCKPEWVVTRIEFSYASPASLSEAKPPESPTVSRGARP